MNWNTCVEFFEKKKSASKIVVDVFQTIDSLYVQ